MSPKTSGPHILIIGIRGGLAQALARLLLRELPQVTITGVDTREPPRNLDSVRLQCQTIAYNRSNFEKLFRKQGYDYVFHLGRLSNALPNANIRERADVNVVGTQTILELAHKHKTKKVVVLSTYHVYGANADNPFYIPESYPLRASFRYHELHDVVEMDQGTTSFMWRHRNDMEIVILRPCNIIGPRIHNAMTQFLKAKLGPMPIDYKPMFQFIYESDMAKVLAASLHKLPGGIYNVAPSDTISLHRAQKYLGGHRWPAPISVLAPLASILNIPVGVPGYLMEYLKYSCVIDTSEIRTFLGDDFYEFSSEAAIVALGKSK